MYAKVQWIQIARIENISSHIEFAGKKSKAKDEFKKRKEWSLEVLAYSILHFIQQP